MVTVAAQLLLCSFTAPKGPLTAMAGSLPAHSLGTYISAKMIKFVRRKPLAWKIWNICPKSDIRNYRPN